MRWFILRLIFFLLSAYFFISCEKTDDLSRLKLDYVYDGSFSLPIGDTSLSLPNNGSGLPPNWQNLPDSLLQKLNSFSIKSKTKFFFINPISSLEYIKQLVFRLDAQNDFPATIHLRFYFLSADGNVLDSLTNIPEIPPSVIGSDGSVNKRGEIIEDIEITSENYYRWLHVTDILVSADIINPKVAAYYKYFPNYKLRLNMGFRVYFDFNIHRNL